MIEPYISCKDDEAFLLTVRAALLMEQWGDLIPDYKPFAASTFFQEQINPIDLFLKNEDHVKSIKTVFEKSDNDFEYVNHILTPYLQGVTEKLLDVEREVLLQSISVLTNRDALVLAIRFGLFEDTTISQTQQIDEAIELLTFCRETRLEKAFKENNPQHLPFPQFIQALINQEITLLDALPDVDSFLNAAQNNTVFLELLNRNCILPTMDEKERLNRKKEQLLSFIFSDNALITTSMIKIIKNMDFKGFSASNPSDFRDYLCSDPVELDGKKCQVAFSKIYTTTKNLLGVKNVFIQGTGIKSVASFKVGEKKYGFTVKEVKVLAQELKAMAPIIFKQWISPILKKTIPYSKLSEAFKHKLTRLEMKNPRTMSFFADSNDWDKLNLDEQASVIKTYFQENWEDSIAWLSPYLKGRIPLEKFLNICPNCNTEEKSLWLNYSPSEQRDRLEGIQKEKLSALFDKIHEKILNISTTHHVKTKNELANSIQSISVLCTPIESIRLLLQNLGISFCIDANPNGDFIKGIKKICKDELGMIDSQGSLPRLLDERNEADLNMTANHILKTCIFEIDPVQEDDDLIGDLIKGLNIII